MPRKIKIPPVKVRVRCPIVCIRFLDHTFHDGEPEQAAPLECEVYGVLWREDKKAYYVATWISEQNLLNSNNDTYCILKSAVLSVSCFHCKNRR